MKFSLRLSKVVLAVFLFSGLFYPFWPRWYFALPIPLILFGFGWAEGLRRMERGVPLNDHEVRLLLLVLVLINVARFVGIWW